MEEVADLSTLQNTEVTDEVKEYIPIVRRMRSSQYRYVVRNSTTVPHKLPCNGNPGDKRKKVTLSMEEKLRALQRLDAGEPLRIIAKDLGVGRSTVSDWKKHRLEIERWYANQTGNSSIKARKTMRKGKHARVEKALYHWFEYNKSKGFPVSGQLLQQKALHFKEKIDGEEGEQFSASEGWLDRWKKRFGIGLLVNDNENENDYFVEELRKDLECSNLKEEQIYCCGQTLLNYRLLPPNILGSNNKVTEEYDVNEETMMLFACCNATGGHKLRLTFIVKSDKFQEFETVKDNELLPFGFFHHKEVWLDDDIFKTWFHNEFVPAVEKDLLSKQLARKAVLLVTYYPAFSCLSELHDKDIRVIFIPVHAASSCQPMNQGVFELLKKKYWCRLLRSVISTRTDCEDCITTVRNVEIIEAIQFASEAWEEIPTVSLIQLWDHLTNQREYKDWAACESQIIDVANDEKELASLLKKIVGSDDINMEDLNEWLVNEDEDEVVCEDIVAMVLKEPQLNLDLSGDNSISNEEPSTEAIEIKTELTVEGEDTCAGNTVPQVERISHFEGFKAISKALDYINQQQEATPEDITWMVKWRDSAAGKSLLEASHKMSGKRPKLI
ncbi:tigger transposable element-derived protein 2-like [Macrosteles quadrilineatus]|uniref:tigger transposable element-derived protein 2-like n=1 Tax=Macrosteles quadrilineatus TaxID=74068 RepID=UPI0023E25EBF|nr:tigger transposable element-derived protein 2-like [Macrosteles quadrilineatus]